jgi:4-amino-4-deoxy-L-arabinose transferase-like glycosyltransferase
MVGRLSSESRERRHASGADPRHVWGRWTWALVAVVVAGAFVRLWGLGRQSLWIDEVITLKAANVGGSFGFQDVIGNIQGPLHAFLVHWVSKLSTGEAALRSISAIAGILTIPVMAELGRRLFDRRTGFFAALLFALSPYSVWYSQEVRNYSLLMFAAAVATLAVLRVAQERRGGFAPYAAATVAALYLNMSAVFMAMGHGLYGLFSLRGKRLGLWLVTLAVVVALFVPGMWSVVRWARADEVGERVALTTDAEPEELLRGETTFTPAALPYAVFALGYGYTLGPNLTELHVGSPMSAFMAHLPSVAPAGLVLTAALLLGLVRVWSRRDAGSLLLLTLLVPAVGAIVLAVANIKPFNVRYLSPGLPALLLLAAAGVGMLRRRAAALLCAALVLFCGLSLRNYHAVPTYGRDDVRSAVEFVAERERPNDVVLVPAVLDVFRHYYEGPAELVVLYPAQTGTDEEVARRLKELLGDAPRVWYIESRPWHVDPANRIPAYLGRVYERAESERMPGVRVELYTRAEAGGEVGAKG